MKLFVISDFIVLWFLLIFYVILSDMYESQPDAIFYCAFSSARSLLIVLLCFGMIVTCSISLYSDYRINKNKSKQNLLGLTTTKKDFQPLKLWINEHVSYDSSG
jgi:hypothetical protein